MSDDEQVPWGTSGPFGRKFMEAMQPPPPPAPPPPPPEDSIAYLKRTGDIAGSDRLLAAENEKLAAAALAEFDAANREIIERAKLDRTIYEAELAERKPGDEIISFALQEPTPGKLDALNYAVAIDAVADGVRLGKFTESEAKALEKRLKDALTSSGKVFDGELHQTWQQRYHAQKYRRKNGT